MLLDHVCITDVYRLLVDAIRLFSHVIINGLLSGPYYGNHDMRPIVL